MRAVWQLSINTCAGRKTRTTLLVAAVALSTALVSAVACAMASLNEGLESRVRDRVGSADVRIRHVAGDRFADDVLALVIGHPDVSSVSPRVRGAVRINPKDPEADASGERSTLSVLAIDPGTTVGFGVPEPVEGRLPAAPDELLIDQNTATEFGYTLGDAIAVQKFADGASGTVTVPMTLVGLSPNLTLDVLDRPQGVVTRKGLERTAGLTGALSEIQLSLADTADAEAFAESITERLPGGLLAEPTALVTSGIASMMRANTITFILAASLAFLSAAFIVLTGLTSTAAERQRELAILRCIGARRHQLAATQLALGAVLGLAGAVVGVPLGMLIAYLLTLTLPDRLPAGFVVWPIGLVMAAVGSIVAGVLGAGWSAYRASRANPLPAMRSKATAASRRAIAAATVAGLLGIAIQLIVVTLAPDPDTLFWTYVPFGLPAMFVGYFLLAVPISIIAARLLAPILARVLRIPPTILGDSFAAAPFRNGFTAGALMLGLAMMVSIWTNGNAILRDWFNSIRFPDAFINSLLAELTQDHVDRVDELPFVESTARITLFKTRQDAFGIGLVQRPKTSFIAFDPDEFFPMARLDWSAGDPETAIPRLKQGGAVLVAREFLVQREGFGVGSTFVVEHRGREIPFEIVGAVSSPGLDIVSKYFDLGEEYADHAIHSVFGTRDDLARHFGDTSIDLLQITFDPGQSLAELSDQDAVQQIRDAINLPGAFVGSGREIKASITDIGTNSMRVASLIAMAAMLIGSLGVGNIVVTSIDARRFEFGVLRAIGAGRWAVARLITAEVLLIAAVATVLGTLMGVQGAYAGTRLYALVAGLELRPIPPLGVIAIGAAALFAISLAVTAPMILALARQHPRQLLSATRG